MDKERIRKGGNMALDLILKMNLIKNNTEIIIRDQDSHVVAQGNWYQDDILDYAYADIESFTWQDDNKLFIDLK